MYTPPKDFAGFDEITMSARSSYGEHAETQIAVVVDPVNDAPSITQWPSSPKLLQLGSVSCVLDELRVEDRDDDDSLLTLRVSTSNGSLRLAPLACSRYGVQLLSESPGVLELRASAERLNSFLNACSVNYVSPRRTLKDNEMTVSVADEAKANETRVLDVLFGPPPIPQLVDCGLKLTEGAASSLSIAMVGGVDDGPRLRLNWFPTEQLAYVGNGDEGVNRSFEGEMAIKFRSPARLRQAISRGEFVYTPKPYFFGVDLFNLTLSDFSGSSSGASSQIECVVHVSPVNQAPTLTGLLTLLGGNPETMLVDETSLRAGWTTNQDVPVLLRGFKVQDVDNEEIKITITVRDQAPARLKLTGLPTGIRLNTFGGGGKVAISGSVAAVNAALGGLEYSPPSDFVGRTVIAIHVQDNGGFERDENRLETTALASVEVRRVDRPVTLELDSTVLNDGRLVQIYEDTVLRLSFLKLMGPYGSRETFDMAMRVEDCANGTFHLVGNHDLRTDFRAEMLMITGKIGDMSRALGDIQFSPPSDWHGVATLHVQLNQQLGVIGNLSFRVVVVAVQDAPVISFDVRKKRLIDEDAIFDDFSDVVIADVDFEDEWFEKSPTARIEVRIASSHGFLSFRYGSYGAAARTGSSIVEDEGSTIRFRGTPQQVTEMVSKFLRFRPLRDFHGEAEITVRVDDRGGYPCNKDRPILATGICPDPNVVWSTLRIAVAPVNDAPRIHAPTSHSLNFKDSIMIGRAYDSIFRIIIVSAGDGTKHQFRIEPISIEDPDSHVVTVELVPSGGMLRVVNHNSRKVKYTPPQAGSGAFVDHLVILAEIDAVNAALSSIVWLGDGLRDRNTSSGITIVAADREGASSSARIHLLDSSIDRSPLQVTLDRPDASAIFEDQTWMPIVDVAEISERADELLTARVSSRDEAKLEVHVVQTSAPSTRNKYGAVHVITLLNATDRAAIVTKGYFTLTVDWRDQVTREPSLLPADTKLSTTTDSISFDAVAKVDDERRNVYSRRELLPDGRLVHADLTGESVEAKLRALENVRKSGVDISVSKESDNLVDPVVEGSPTMASRAERRWRVTLSGASPELLNAPIVARQAHEQNENSSIEVASKLVLTSVFHFCPHLN